MYYIIFKMLIGVQEVDWAMPWKNILIAVTGSIAVTFIASLLPMRKINYISYLIKHIAQYCIHGGFI